jgi:hypothetical protein
LYQRIHLAIAVFASAKSAKLYTLLVQDFLKSKDAHAEIENAPKNAATSLRNAVKNLGVADKVEVKTIGGVVYLTKK